MNHNKSQLNVYFIRKHVLKLCVFPDDREINWMLNACFSFSTYHLARWWKKGSTIEPWVITIGSMVYAH